ncbi:SulP family inorganic anion transporter [Aquibaculum sediminis]|uniref:SulP family inorganic anion transporter n=1 Tax=Aquibaculum sediminis TaxID=3231907 RepID=UPI0034557D4F
MWQRYFPALIWLRTYSRSELSGDLIAGVIVTVMLVPQSLAYALLAGLPPQVGLYASILPLVVYALFGSSRTLAVGPVAVLSLMTASAIGQLGLNTLEEQLAAALILALISGLVLTVMGLLRLGFLANLLSHPVVSAFISASALLIAFSQLGQILGLSLSGARIDRLLEGLLYQVGEINPVTAAIGLGAVAFLYAARRFLVPWLRGWGVSEGQAQLAGRVAPILAVVGGTLLVGLFRLDEQAGVAVVGAIPAGLPPFSVPTFDTDLWLSLLPAAILISLVGFVESVSVAQSLAAKRREKVEPNQELIGLGTANLAAAFSGGYPVTGGFARSVVNFAAGARTPLAGVVTAALLALVALLLTDWFRYLPNAVLAATIIVAVLGLVDFAIARRLWRYSKADAAAWGITFVGVLALGVETGVVAGVLVSLALYLWRSGRPHMAVVGQVPGTEHYRNILRHQVITHPRLLAVRVDESLYFVNARYLEDSLLRMTADRPEVEHVVLICSAVNLIDASALESLEALASRLVDAGVQLHLAEVKGPVMDRLKRSSFLEHLSGRIYLSTHGAVTDLTGGGREPTPHS